MQRKLKLLVIPDLFPAYDGDWMGIFVVDYLKAVAPWCDVSVFYSRLAGEKTGAHSETFAGFPTTRFNMLSKKPKGLLKLPAYKKWLKASVQEALKLPKPDVIHAHSAVLYGTLGLKLAKHWDVPIVLSEHTGPFSTVSSSGMKLRKAKKVMGEIDATLAVSEHLASEIRNSDIQPKKLIVSGNPVDTALFAPNPTQELHKNMLFISRLDVFKGGLRTLKAYHSILPQNPDWKLTIGGDGEEMQAIKDYVAANNLSEKVSLIGKLTKPEIAAEFHKADFLIFPSVHESFGLVAAEALSAGLPVIATKLTAPPEFVNSENGILVDPMNVEEIAQAMTSMMARLPNIDAAAIRKSIEDRFSFDVFGKKLMDIYSEL